MTATWPDGVIVRARTFGGGVIDIRHGHPAGKDETATGHCSGCNATNTLTGVNPRIAVGRIMRWARDHATCPFMPKPEGSR